MSLIAAIALQWTEIENALVDLLGNALGLTWSQGGGSLSHKYDLVARTALEQADTIRARLKLIDATLGFMIVGTVLEQSWGDLRQDLQRRSRERNRVVHARWGYSELVPRALINDLGSRRELWSQDDFRDVLQRMQKLWGSLLAFSHQVGKAKISGIVAPFRGAGEVSMPANLPNLGYNGLSAEANDVERTATAALVLVINVLRELRSSGLLSQEALEMNFENAAAVTQPRVGSNLEHLLFAHLSEDRKARQYKNRGIGPRTDA